ncbi:hypothetical protein LTR56_026296 [Elasticomyces elasticus]|nr:hypothetical protein LTR56_026296 [Elasticomyces elasticus]KAK3662945.1 hypothetical protein LTR22_006109 [Elasticomyces elasticus]
MTLEEAWTIQSRLAELEFPTVFSSSIFFALFKRWFSGELNADGRFNFEQYIAHPWYIRPTLYNRWSLNSWLIRMVGGSVPGDEGLKYYPQGYIVTELGPENLRGKG